MKRGYSRDFRPRTERRVTIQIDRVPPTLKARAQARAKREGVSLRALLLGWLGNWAAGRRPDENRGKEGAMKDFAGLTFHVAPEDQGQIVEVAYAADGEHERIVRRTTDQSNRSVVYDVAPWAALRGAFEPWNAAPTVVGAWTRVTA